ncbi:MAG: D-alanyl-D-alanine carboxypeptidase, partial [Propionibacteriaceae bacterium]|nr:D-alanyl-D-alanine carboxypeptidase [Propionibacteriaceae bacterium]
MSEPSLSLAADRARWLSCPSSGPRRLLGLLTAALLAGCTVAGATPTSPVPAPADVTVSAVAPSPTPTESVLPDPSKVARKVGAVSRSGIGTSGIAVLAGDGTSLTARRADQPLAPASTMKVLTSMAALDTLGADHRFVTSVVGSGRQVVLVGGGDPLLTDKQSKSATKPASLQALARATAAALAAAGVKRIRLGYDTSRFSGPDFNRDWKPRWRSWVARVSPLLIGEGRFNRWQADPSPARTAARAFAKRLEAAGIKVSGVVATEAPAGATQLASVESASLATVVRRTLKVSDNLAAEVIARQLAIAAGEPGSFAGAAAALKTWLSGRGLWADGMRVVDGSGLSMRA